jgi:mitochondrial GTPase 1
MTRFSRILPDLLARTDVVLELRDARLPLSSVNKNLEGKRYRREAKEPPPPGRRQRCVCGSGGGDPTCCSYIIFLLWGLSYEPRAVR